MNASRRVAGKRDGVNEIWEPTPRSHGSSAAVCIVSRLRVNFSRQTYRLRLYLEYVKGYITVQLRPAATKLAWKVVVKLWPYSKR